MAVMRKPKPPQTLTTDQEVAHDICNLVYHGCGCRERGRGQVCDTMKSAASIARLHFEAEFAKRRV